MSMRVSDTTKRKVWAAFLNIEAQHSPSGLVLRALLNVRTGLSERTIRAVMAEAVREGLVLRIPYSKETSPKLARRGKICGWALTGGALVRRKDGEDLASAFPKPPDSGPIT